MQQVIYEYDFHKNYSLKIKKSVYTGKGLCGILNIGNTCFINSILQCLSHTLKLTDYILSTDYRDDYNNSKRKNEFYVLNSYVTLINNVWNENQLIKPKSFVENLSKFHSKYFTLQQQDSHECLLYILDLLHKSLSYEIDVEIKGEIKTKSDVLMKKSLENWRHFYEKDYSFIIETFYGSLINNINCINDKCNYSDEIFEPYNTLSVSIPETSSTLYECLDTYFNEHDEIGSWKCEKCNNNGCNKSIDLWTLPNNFIINLKRFRNNNDLVNKNTNMVTFPLIDLDLTKYISKNKSEPYNFIYDCYAINYHSGNINGGHYHSACKNLDGKWYNMNDGDVSVYNGTINLVTQDAYILFYQRKFIKKSLNI